MQHSSSKESVRIAVNSTAATPVESLFSSGMLSLFQALWSFVVGFISVPLLIGGLGYTAYGIYGLGFAVAGFGGFLDLGLNWTIAKFVSEARDADDGVLSEIVWTGLLFNIATITVFWVTVLVSAEVLARKVLHTEPADIALAARVIRICTAAFVASHLTSYISAVLRGLRRFQEATATAMLSNTASLGLAITAAMMGYGASGAAAGSLTGAAVGLAFAVSRFLPHLKALPAGALVFPRLKSLLEFSSWNFGGRVLQILALQGDKVLVGRFAGAAALPFYSVPFNIAQKVNFLGGPAVTAIYPLAATGMHRSEEFFRQYASAARLLHVLTGALAFSVVLFGDRLLEAWLGPRMASDGTFALRAFAVGYWLVSVGSFDGACLEGWNRARLVFFLSGISFVGGFVGMALAGIWLDASQSIVCGVALWLSITGICHTLAWLRVSEFPVEQYFFRITKPVIEMAIFGAALAAFSRPLSQGKVMGFANVPVAATLMAAFGLWRAFEPSEIWAIAARVMPARTSAKRAL